MSNSELAVGVKLHADTAQYTAEITRAGQTLSTFAAQVQGGSGVATSALQSMATAAQAGGSGLRVVRLDVSELGGELGKMTAGLNSVAAGLQAWTQKAEQAAQRTSAGAERIADTHDRAGSATRQLGREAGTMARQLARGGDATQALAASSGNLARSLLGAAPVVGTAVLALGAMAKAALGGAAEMQGYQKALIMTGNAAGITAGQMADMARAIDQSVGTQGQAAQVLTQLAASGKVAGEGMQGLAQAAIEAQRSLGQPVDDTVRQYERLGDAPVTASAKLNESIHHLTAGTYDQIRAAQELGNREDAARVAQEAYAGALRERAAEMEKNLGALQKAWRWTGEAAREAWDWMMNIGRARTAQQQIESATGAVEALQKQLESRQARGLATGDIQAQFDAARRRLTDLQNEAALTDVATQAQKKQNDATQAYVALGQLRQQHLSREEQMQRKVVDATRVYEAALKDTTLTAEQRAKAEQDYKAIVSDITKTSEKRASATKAHADGELASLQSQLQAARLYGQQLGELGLAAQKMTAGEQAALKLGEQIRQSTDAKTTAALQRKQALAEELGAQQRHNQEVEKALKLEQEQVQSAQSQAEGINKRAAELQASNEVWGKGKVAIAEYRAEQARQAVDMAQVAGKSDAYVQALQAIAQAQERVTVATRQAEFKRITQGLDEWARASSEQLALYADEYRLAGLSAQERAKAVALRKVELELAKRIAEIDRSGLTEEEKKAARAEANAAADVARQAEVARVTAEEWQKTSDQINQSLTDALMRGFEDGKGFVRNFGDTLKNMFRTMVLRPVISFIVQPLGNVISAAIGGLLGVGSGQSGAGSSILGAASNANSLWNIFGGTAEGLSGVGYNALAALPGSIGYGALPGMSMGSQQAAMLAAQTQGFGGAGLQATAGAAQYGGAGWMSSAAAGAAVVALPLIIGSLLEMGANNNQRMIGAASSGAGITPGVAAGSTAFDLAGRLPDRQALIDELIGKGAPADLLAGLNDRQLQNMLLAPATRVDPQHAGERYTSWGETAQRDAGVADFYRGPGYVNPETLGLGVDHYYGSGHEDLNQLRGVDPRLIEQSRALAQGITAPLNTLAHALDEKASKFEATVGFAFDADKGWDAALRVSRGGQDVVNNGRREFESQDEALRAMFTDALGAFGALDLPDWAKKQVDGAKAQLASLTGDKIGEQATAIYQQSSAGIAQTYVAIQQLIDYVPLLSGSTQDVVHALADAGGGLDAFTQKLGAWHENFYSASERQAMALEQVRGEFEALDLAMPANRAALRDMVQGIDLSTEAGRTLFAQLQELAPHLAEVMPQLFEGASELAGLIRDGLLGTFAGADLGAAMAQTVEDGIYNAIAGRFSGQITDIIVGGVVDPIIQAAVTGATLTGVVSQASIDQMVAQATAVAEAAAVVFDDPGFKEAMARIGQSVASIHVPAVRASTSVREYSSAVRESGNAADDAAKKALSGWKQLLGEVKGVFDVARDAARSLRGEVDGAVRLSAASAQAYIDQALAAARATGALPDADALRNAIGDARAGLRVQDYASVAEYERDQLILAGKLDALGDVAGGQMDYAQRQVDLLEKADQKWDQQLELMRLQMRAQGINVPAGGAGGNADVVGELRGLQGQFKALLDAINRSVDNGESTLNLWRRLTGNGTQMPTAPVATP